VDLVRGYSKQDISHRMSDAGDRPKFSTEWRFESGYKKTGSADTRIGRAPSGVRAGAQIRLSPAHLGMRESQAACLGRSRVPSLSRCQYPAFS